MKSIRHLIQCRCFLQPLKTTGEFHQFIVFSLINDDDTVKSKFVQCPNCGIIHRVYEVGRSEILKNKENMNSIVSIEDIKLSLNPKLVSILEKYEITDVSAWEEVKFIVDSESWGSFIVLSKENEGDETSIKMLKIISKDLFMVDNEIRHERL